LAIGVTVFDVPAAAMVAERWGWLRFTASLLRCLMRLPSLAWQVGKPHGGIQVDQIDPCNWISFRSSAPATADRRPQIAADTATRRVPP